jgi:crotonobetainyl-CoA hydratase
MDLLMTGRRMELDEAMHYGLVNRRTSLQNLKNHAIEWAHEVAQSAPLALASIKAVMRETENLKLEDAYKLMRSDKIEVYQQMLRSEDAEEGPLAFSEKRVPEWKGR